MKTLKEIKFIFGLDPNLTCYSMRDIFFGYDNMKFRILVELKKLESVKTSQLKTYKDIYNHQQAYQYYLDDYDELESTWDDFNKFYRNNGKTLNKIKKFLIRLNNIEEN